MMELFRSFSTRPKGQDHQREQHPNQTEERKPRFCKRTPSTTGDVNGGGGLKATEKMGKGSRNEPAI